MLITKMEMIDFLYKVREEDDLLTGFVDWLCSLDGGRKPRRTALKHKSVLMSIVRYDEEQSPDYKNICNRSFLNGWDGEGWSMRKNSQGQ